MPAHCGNVIRMTRRERPHASAEHKTETESIGPAPRLIQERGGDSLSPVVFSLISFEAGTGRPRPWSCAFLNQPCLPLALATSPPCHAADCGCRSLLSFRVRR